MVKNWTKKLTARALRVCENLRLKHHPGYAPKTNTNTNTQTPKIGGSHAAQAHVSEKQPTSIQAWRKTRPQAQPPYPPHERRYQALKCDASTPYMAFEARGAASLSLVLIHWLSP